MNDHEWDPEDLGLVLFDVAAPVAMCAVVILLNRFRDFLFVAVTAEILGEDAILSWHSKDHSTKGKSVFLADMNEFVNWLKSAVSSLPVAPFDSGITYLCLPLDAFSAESQSGLCLQTLDGATHGLVPNDNRVCASFLFLACRSTRTRKLHC